MGHSYKNSPRFKGPYPLTKIEILQRVSDHYGVYILTNIDKGIFFTSYEVLYVGRGHLSTRLKQRVGNYTHFYYRIANNEYTRFRVECEEFHRYGKGNRLHNQIHPAKPKGDYKKCTEMGCNGESH